MAESAGTRADSYSMPITATSALGSKHWKITNPAQRWTMGIADMRMGNHTIKNRMCPRDETGNKNRL